VYTNLTDTIKILKAADERDAIEKKEKAAKANQIKQKGKRKIDTLIIKQ
jgi:hypothetical protein